ncbi:MAG TPA: sulfite exporter TauE/SafE family protein [Rhodocyclaceae bacterium]|nr:sulfite exporter TauE/SafE family protein [Rhodocyclaceae bacterium]
MKVRGSVFEGGTRMDFVVDAHMGLALVVGAGLGFFGGLFGIGGGILAIPLFVLGFGMEQAQAQGTALVLMVPNLLVGWWRYQQRQPMPWRAQMAIASSATLVTWGMAHFATQLDPLVLRGVFCVFLLALAIRLWRAAPAAAGAEKPLALRWLPVVGAAGGCSMGLLGIGGGLLATPLLAGWLGQRQAVAQGLSLALVAPSSAVALAAYASAGHVDWSRGLPMAVGGLATVSAGVAWAHRLPERRMRTAFAAMLGVTALWLGVGRWLMG